MTQVTEADISTALKSVKIPDSDHNIVDTELVSGLVIKDGHVQFALEIDPAHAERMEPVRKQAEQTVATLPGVLSVTAVLTAHRRAEQPAQQAQQPQQQQPKKLLPQVGAIVAVASGKGGVGKSTTAANLAVAFRAMGLRTAMLDADIYGPSLPTMMGISGRPQSPDGKTIIPMEAHGITFGVIRKTSDIPNDRTFTDSGGVVASGPGAPSARTIGSPVFMRGQEKTTPMPAPEVGQHSDEVLAELGYSADEIRSMRSVGTLQ